MRRKFERLWVNKEMKKEIKMFALEKGKNVVDLKPEDIFNNRKKKREAFSFRI